MNIHSAWKDTCRILLGKEIGELEEYGDYLSRYLGKVSRRESSLSSREVWVSSTKKIPPDARLLAYDEIERYQGMLKNHPVNINDIKDVDSLVSALRERFYYAGNTILGNSDNVERSDACSEAHNVFACQNVYEASNYVAYSDRVRLNEMCFGVTIPGESKFIIRGMEMWRNTRCFEVLRTFNSSDCYFTANMLGCTSCMFSFNQRSRNHLIGNLQLPKDRYLAIKQKLVEEMRSELEAKKGIMGIVDLVSGSIWPQPEKKPAAHFRPPSSSPPAEIQSAFDLATKLVLGQPLGPISDYEGWLNRDVGQIMETNSVLSNAPVFVAPLDFVAAIGRNSVTVEEALRLGEERKADDKTVGELSFSNAAEKLKDIAITSAETVFGDYSHVVDCACYGNKTMHAFRTSSAYGSKYVSHSHWPRGSEYVFGSSIALLSRFCLKCYNSTYLTRCFEVDSSHRCTDCYFCHNCEGLQDCMFCFNAKSLRYAVGNMELGREQYLKIKKLVLADIAKRLERQKTLGYGIFNIGCRKG